MHELCTACRTGDKQTVEALLKSRVVDINNADEKYGLTPLMYAMLNNHPAIVAILLDSPKLNLGSNNSSGITGLHNACYTNSSSVIPLYGRDKRCTPAVLNSKDYKGYTALMRAVERGHLDCVKELDKLEGTNFSIKTGTGETLIDMAERCHHKDVVEYLLQRNKKVDTLEEISASNVARYIKNENDTKLLEIPQTLHILVRKYFDK